MSRSLAHEKWRRANENLNAARVCLDNELYADSISRSYYAAYHIASAVLLTLGVSAKTHRGVRSQFGLHIVTPGLIERNWGSEFGDLQDLRIAADYDVVRRFSEPNARDVLGIAEAFVNRMGPLVGTDG